MPSTTRTTTKTKNRQPAPQPTPGIPCKCDGCHLEFPSRNAVFKHLVNTNGTCLDTSEYEQFAQYVLAQKREKVLILYGYYIPQTNNGSDSDEKESLSSRNKSITNIIKDGDDVAKILLEVLATSVQKQGQQQQNENEDDLDVDIQERRLNRSYGHVSRSTDVVKQDSGTSAITEVLTTRLPPLTIPVREWIDQVNEQLRQRLQVVMHSSTSNDDDASLLTHDVPQIRVFGRKVLPSMAARFNAEMDVSHRRIEYLLPFDFLFPSSNTNSNSNNSNTDPFITDCNNNLNDFFKKFPSFAEGCYTRHHEYYSRHNVKVEIERPEQDTLMYLYKLKKLMQSMTTGVVVIDNKNDPTIAVLENEISEQKRHYNQQQQRNKKKDNDSTNDKEEINNNTNNTDDNKEQQQSGSNSNKKAKKERDNNNNRNNNNKKKKEKKGVMRRKRFHNFTPTVMAHEYLAYRRLDRFYHRATIRFDTNDKLLLPEDDDNVRTKRPFLALSLSGDVFLTGQVCRAVGLFVAVARGVIDPDIVDCVFDEAYPHLCPLPPAPLMGMYAGEAFYDKWEGKLKSVLTPRVSKHYKAEDGWNDISTIENVDEWQTSIREHTVQNWLRDGLDEDGRLVAEKRWTKEVLEPWAERAREQLANYRLWKASMENSKNTATTNGDCTTNGSAPRSIGEDVPLLQLPPPESIDPTVPPLFEKVLSCLREVNESGQWPSTTLKRHLVMVSTLKEEHKSEEGGPATGTVAPSLEVARLRAKSNTESRSSAYIYEEGQGGASGSFSVGAMPADKDGKQGKKQPKANSLFPELMKAAFELEIALFPDREPSSTIAINRNGQFRPHTDVGAGAGQSTSAIVGLGTYSGGELVVEGDQVDIRYSAVEFNGWKQRHWTMPFKGERYSLVWFTPKGCEGVHGIDLCK